MVMASDLLPNYKNGLIPTDVLLLHTAHKKGTLRVPFLLKDKA